MTFISYKESIDIPFAQYSQALIEAHGMLASFQRRIDNLRGTPALCSDPRHKSHTYSFVLNGMSRLC